MKIDFPCKCGHSIEDHEPDFIGELGHTWNNLIGACNHDKAYFKGMCNCSWFTQMNNLEYLEYTYEKTSKVH